MVKHWNKLPMEVLKALSLLVFKKCLDNALTYKVELWVWSQEVDLMILVGPFQVTIYCDSVTSNIYYVLLQTESNTILA